MNELMCYVFVSNESEYQMFIITAKIV